MLRIVSRRFLASYPPHSKVTLPSLSPTMVEGGLAKWCKKEGDRISVGQVLCEVETDKATIDFEFQDDAIIGKRLVAEKTSGIKVGSVIAILVEDEADVPKFANCTFEEFNPMVATVTSAPPPPPPTQQSQEPEPEKKQQQAEPQTKSTPNNTTDRVFASPLARKIAKERGYEIGEISGSGPNGRILASDVYSFEPSTSAGGAEVQDWVSNKHVAPHFYLNIDVDFTEALQVRAKLNTESKLELSVNDFILRAAALSMKRVPECNASWMGDAIRLHKRVDVNVASATKDNGVSYPVLRNLHLAGLAGISTAQPEDEGNDSGTFSLVNVGAYGVKSIVPIVRPGHSCALGVGALQSVLAPGAVGGGAQVRTVGTVTLSCDHRVVDGAVGAQWLQHFKSLVEKPYNMLL